MEGRDFPGGPVVKTPPSNAGAAGSIPGQGAKIPHASQPKHQNIRNIVTNPIKTLKSKVEETNEGWSSPENLHHVAGNQGGL